MCLCVCVCSGACAFDTTTTAICLAKAVLLAASNSCPLSPVLLAVVLVLVFSLSFYVRLLRLGGVVFALFLLSLCLSLSFSFCVCECSAALQTDTRPFEYSQLPTWATITTNLSVLFPSFLLYILLLYFIINITII